MDLKIGDNAPDFHADTTEGRIQFHDWLGESPAVLFSHPKAFTQGCTTKFVDMESITPEFDRRGVKVIGLSCDPIGKRESRHGDVGGTRSIAPTYPIIADPNFTVSKLYGMLPFDVVGDPTGGMAVTRQTVRSLFLITANKKVSLILAYPMTAEPMFDVVLRVIDSLELTLNDRVAIPA